MGIRNTTSRWGALAQLLHWTVVALILVQVALINYADSLPLGMAKLAAIARHKSVGITILVLALIRVVWRWTNQTPALPTTMATSARAQLACAAVWLSVRPAIDRLDDVFSKELFRQLVQPGAAAESGCA